ncbi:MAG: hypothetical protein R2801_04890 [Chitinophagales bacterium]
MLKLCKCIIRIYEATNDDYDYGMTAKNNIIVDDYGIIVDDYGMTAKNNIIVDDYGIIVDDYGTKA